MQEGFLRKSTIERRGIMKALSRFFASRTGIIAVGLFIGTFAALLQKLGNPPNMGICVACFERDIAGALGLHRAGVVQYLRPEIMSFVIGSLIAALLFSEFRPRGGSAPIIRFMLGFFAMIGALVFLGCPWRALLRLAGGDGNAILGISGLVVGIWFGVMLLKSGYSLGRSSETSRPMAGWIVPAVMAALLLLAIFSPKFGSGAIFASQKGPGAMHAPIIISIIVGLCVGFLAQRTRFCTMGAFRDIILMRDFHLFSGVVALLASAFVVNFTIGQFNPGFIKQPVAHANHLWNFGGMVLAGLAFALAGGCPGRQLFLAGEGDGDAGIFVFGMIIGAAFAHNFFMASSPKGPGLLGPSMVIIGLVFCLAIGFAMRERT